MSMPSARRKPRKVPPNVSVRPELVSEARSLSLNISEIVEHALEQALRERRRQGWLAENRESIDKCNQRATTRGVFSDSWRRF